MQRTALQRENRKKKGRKVSTLPSVPNKVTEDGTFHNFGSARPCEAFLILFF
jgi:hypothetical protein